MKQLEIDGQPDYEAMFQKMVEALPAERRLAGLAPEQRLAGLAPEQWSLALPVALLRLLPEEYLTSLPPEVQEKVRRRLKQPAD